MKLTMRQLVNAAPALERLGKEKIGGKNAYAFSKNMDLIASELRAHDKEYFALLAEYKLDQIKPNEKNEISIPPGIVKPFNDALNEQLERELDLGIRIINLPANTEAISGTDLFLLDWMVKIDGLED